MKRSRSLQLGKETLLNLSDFETRWVAAGIPGETQTCDNCYTGACPTAVNCPSAPPTCVTGTSTATTTRPSTR